MKPAHAQHDYVQRGLREPTSGCCDYCVEHTNDHHDDPAANSLLAYHRERYVCSCCWQRPFCFYAWQNWGLKKEMQLEQTELGQNGKPWGIQI